MACTDLFNSLVAFIKATPPDQSASLLGTLSVQHFKSGQVDIVTGYMNADSSTMNLATLVFVGTLTSVLNQQITSSPGEEATVTVLPSGKVELSSPFRTSFTGNCTIDPNFWVGELLIPFHVVTREREENAINFPPINPIAGEECCAMLAFTKSYYTPIQ